MPRLLRSSATLVCAIAGLSCTVAHAQPGSSPAGPHSISKPDAATTPAPTPKTEPTSKPAEPTGYPAAPVKNLYADKDFRGKQAPKLEVEEWFSDKPEFKGKTLLIDFWATWCPPCRKLIPELETWQEKYKADLVVVGVTAEPKKTVMDFVDLRGAGVKYPMARDGQNRTNKEIGVKGIPHVLVISSDGIVRWQGFPESEEDTLTEAKLKQIIDADKAARAKNAPKLDDKKPDPKVEPKPDPKPDAPKPAGK